MKNLYVNFLFGTILTIIVVVSAVQAQSKDDKLISEVKLLRQKLVTAIKERDKKTLEVLCADDYTHTHASGQVDDKQKRIAALTSGAKTIELVDADEINIRIYGKNAAVAVGQSTITDENSNAAKYRWTLLYIKSKNGWQIVASQATRLQ